MGHRTTIQRGHRRGRRQRKRLISAAVDVYRIGRNLSAANAERRSVLLPSSLVDASRGRQLGDLADFTATPLACRSRVIVGVCGRWKNAPIGRPRRAPESTVNDDCQDRDRRTTAPWSSAVHGRGAREGDNGESATLALLLDATRSFDRRDLLSRSFAERNHGRRRRSNARSYLMAKSWPFTGGHENVAHVVDHSGRSKTHSPIVFKFWVNDRVNRRILTILERMLIVAYVSDIAFTYLCYSLCAFSLSSANSTCMDRLIVN